MSAKAKTKNKNNGTTLAEAVAIASTPAAEPPAETAAPATETAPAIEPPAAATEPEAPAPPSLLLRARLATGKAVVTIFSTVRSAQATAVKKSLAWISAADSGLARSLVASEKFLLERLRVTQD